MSHKLIWEGGDTLWCQFFGHVDIADLNNATNDFYNDSRSDQVTIALWDFSTMESFEASLDSVTEIAYIDHAASQYMKPMKAAFISSDPEFLELARHYVYQMKQLGGHWENRLFDSLGEAREWVLSA